MPLYFITGNKNKFEEVKTILPEAEQLEIDLPEIQEIDGHEIIKAKLAEAIKSNKGELIVEDTSLYLDCLNGLPGPLIKWFLKAVGAKGIADMTQKLGNDKAEAKTIIGYAKNGEVKFFEGLIHGQIVAPQGETTFGWDPIFKPKGYDKTFAQMSRQEKNEISMRRLALSKLKQFLN